MSEVDNTFDLTKGLELLAEARAEWSSIEGANKPLLDKIAQLEKDIKFFAKERGEEAVGGGLGVSFVQGRETFDGKMLYDACEKVLKELKKITTLNESEASVSSMALPHLNGAVKFLEYALEDGKKTGEKTLRIAAVKEKKGN